MARITFDTWGETFLPRWAGDFYGRDALVPGGAKVLASAFVDAEAGTRAVVGAAGAAANDTAIPVAALTNPIPSGTVLDFGAKKFAQLTATAAKGATSLTVEALATALVSGDTATYEPNGTRLVPAGTLVGRTFAERAAGTAFGPWASGDDEVYLLAHDVYDALVNNDCDLYRNGLIVKENFLPNFDTLTSGQLAALRAAYTTTIGAD